MGVKGLVVVNQNNLEISGPKDNRPLPHIRHVGAT